MKNEHIIFVPLTGNKLSFNLELAGITYEDPTYSITRNSLDLYTVEYVISGKGYIEADGKNYTVRGGDTYILPRVSKLHYYSDKDDPWRKMWFNANGALAFETERILGINNIVVFRETNTMEYFERILAICSNKAYTGDEISCRCAGVSIEMAMFLSKTINRDKSIPPEAVSMREYIDSHISDKITVKKLASLIYRSESQAIRIFRKSFGITPYDYVIDCRINRAKSIIKNTSVPIKDIAFSMNFADEHYFSGIFKKKTGYSPSEYRKMFLLK